jgi:hypothetical protein
MRKVKIIAVVLVGFFPVRTASILARSGESALDKQADKLFNKGALS